MSDLKLDLQEIGNPSLTIGVADYGALRSTRPFIVKDMGGTRRENQKDAAIAFIESHQDTLCADGIPCHPDFTEYGDLPLAAVRVQPFANHAIGVGFYGRTGLSLSRYPAFEFARKSSFVGGKRVIRFFGEETYSIPTLANVNEVSSDGWHISYRWLKQEFRRSQIIVTTKLLDAPEPKIIQNTGKESMDEVYNTINATPFRINGYDYPAGSLRFADMAVRPIDTYNGRQWLVQYEFVYDPRTFFYRVLLWFNTLCQYVSPTPNTEDDCDTSNYSYVTLYKEITLTEPLTFVHSYYGEGVTYIGRRTTRYTPVYNTLEFNGAFPTHDQLEGYRSSLSERPSIPRNFILQHPRFLG